MVLTLKHITKKDQYQAYLDEAEEINEDIKELNRIGGRRW